MWSLSRSCGKYHGANDHIYLGLQSKPESWNMGLGGLVLGSLILYLKGMRKMMFQLSGFYCMLSDLRAAMLDSSDAVESQVFATGKGKQTAKLHVGPVS